MADPSVADRVASREVAIGGGGPGYAESGFDVIGCDIAPDRAKVPDAGRSYVDGVPDERLGATRR